MLSYLSGFYLQLPGALLCVSVYSCVKVMTDQPLSNPATPRQEIIDAHSCVSPIRKPACTDYE